MDNAYNKINEIRIENDHYVFNCPYCDISCIVHINEVNCKIFRCGVFTDTFQQINPHAGKEECENYVLNNRIYGCGKPYMMSIGSMVVFPVGYES